MAQVIFMSTPHDGSTYKVRDDVTIKATIDASTLSSTYDKYTVRFYINGSRTSPISVTSSWKASMNYTFTQDDMGTTTIYAVLCNSSGSELGPISGTVSITVKASLPGVWSWTSTIGGTLKMTSVGSNKYEIFPMTAKEWNDFIGYIRTWAQLQNVALSQDDYTNAAAVSNTTMKASQAQAVVNLLKDLGPPTKPPKAPYAGDSITADFINGLATSLNSMRKLYE